MFWKRLYARLVTPGQLVRDEHSAWLTRALASGRAYPRIPLRRVAEGGFDRVMRLPSGPAQAERWWRIALERVD
jgi:hypothetical protein